MSTIFIIISLCDLPTNEPRSDKLFGGELKPGPYDTAKSYKMPQRSRSVRSGGRLSVPELTKGAEHPGAMHLKISSQSFMQLEVFEPG